MRGILTSKVITSGLSLGIFFNALSPSKAVPTTVNCGSESIMILRIFRINAESSTTKTRKGHSTKTPPYLFQKKQKRGVKSVKRGFTCCSNGLHCSHVAGTISTFDAFDFGSFPCSGRSSLDSEIILARSRMTMSFSPCFPTPTR